MVSPGAGVNVASGDTVPGVVSPGDGDNVLGAVSPGEGLNVGDASWANTFPLKIPPSKHSAIAAAIKTFLDTCSFPSK